MLKKMIATILLIGFIGILIWGGVNRTMAKTDPSEGRYADNQKESHEEYSTENGIQQQGNGNQGQGKNVQSGTENLAALEQISVESQTDHEANTAAKGVSGDDYGAQRDNQTQSQGNGSRGGRGNGNGQGNGQGGGSDPLTTSEIEALYLALDDEYHALAVYQSVMAKFGEVDPFVEVAASEQRHIEALINQFNKHELAIPENPWLGNIAAFESIQQACQAGVAAEVENAALYERLFAMTNNTNLIRVFTNLSSASLNSHLPQFEACQ